MKIDTVTITGADNTVHHDDLAALQEEFPFVEWGILFSESKQGKSRYPTQEHIKKHFTSDLNLSAHFCGWWSREVLENGRINLISDLRPQFKRVQLNYNFANSSGWEWSHVIKAIQDSGRRIILQDNRSNQLFLDRWLLSGNVPDSVHFLYDSSGGRGKLITNIQEPLVGHYTGYSGGINLTTIDSICSDIGRFKDKSDVWIDMESGVRSLDDKFDLELVRKVLEKCEYHIHR